MSSITSEIKLRIKAEGEAVFQGLGAKLNNLASQTTISSAKFKVLSTELREVQQKTGANSIKTLKDYAASWRELANSVDIASKEFKEASTEAARLEAQLAKAQGRRGAGGQFKGIAQGVGTVAAAGVFGGPLGAVGALAGAPFGVAGMAAGGAIGAQGGMMLQQVAGLASYTAELDKQRLALKLVTQDGASYQQGLAFINETSRELAIPQELITKQFTQLSASVLGAGGNIKDAETAFLGIAAGIRGTGGSLEDLDGALRATAQVFSKGKVSAEELRQQIGERLPGAFTLFAKAIDKTPQQLDKALEDGSVSLQDFLTFARKLYEEYGENSKILAKGPESAGDRLKTALSRLSESVGRLLKPIGAAFQSIFADIVNSIDGAARGLARFFGIKFYDPTRIKELTTDISRLKKEIEALPGGKGRTTRENLLLLKEQELVAQKALAPATTGPARPSNLPGAGGGGEGSSLLKKLQSEFGKTVGVIGRQMDVKKQKDMLDQVYNLERKIQTILKSGTTEGVAQLRQQQQRVALTTAQKYLLEEQGLLYDEIKKGEQKGLDVTSAKVQLDRVGNEIKKIGNDLLKLDNDTLQQMNEESSKLAEQMKAMIPSYAEGAEEMPTVFKIMSDQIKELAVAVEDSLPRIMSLADALSTALAGAFEGMVFAAQSAQESLGQMFTNIAKSFQGMVMQMITDYLKMQIMTFFRNIFAPSPISVAGNYFSGSGSSMFANPSFGFGGVESSLSSNTALLQYAGVKLAMGGIMTANGPLKLKKYGSGGIAYSPQLAMFGEGSTPEAYVPLPDGKSIPVMMKGSSMGGNIIVNVDATGSSVEGNASQGKALASVVGAAVQAELIKQKKPGGLLY